MQLQKTDLFYQTVSTWIFALVLGAGGFYSIVKEPTSVREPSEALLAPGRGPASVYKGAAALLETTQAEVIIDCAQKIMSSELRAKRVRFLGRNCGFNATSEVSLVNSSNGFSASFMVHSEQEFTTDYVDVNPGENHFLFSRKNQAGKVIEQSFSISVRSAQAQ